MSRVIIIGCGVIGAAIAYELSQVAGLDITVIDQQPPATGSTGAALGVLMAAVRQKAQGKAWKMRAASIQRYETLIPELEARTKIKIPFNRQGIIVLCWQKEDLTIWENLAAARQAQGWRLEIWQPEELKIRCPQIDCSRIQAAIYSPQDRQVDPVQLTLALVAAAEQNGVNFQFGVTALGAAAEYLGRQPRHCDRLHTTAGDLPTDWLVVAAGLGAFSFTRELQELIDIQPVLGQALHLRVDTPLGNQDFQPVITGEDAHIVPIGEREYWLGATIEFPSEKGEILPDHTSLKGLMTRAIAFCPPLAEATILRTWSGLRPRPENRPAPIIGELPGYDNVLMAAGHYRNGILLAPPTAEAIKEYILAKKK